MKRGPVNTFRKRKKTASKNLTVTSCQKTVMSLSYFQFMANLKQFGNQIPDTYPVKCMVSSKVTFYLTKTENRTKTSLTQLKFLA